MSLQFVTAITTTEMVNTFIVELSSFIIFIARIIVQYLHEFKNY